MNQEQQQSQLKQLIAKGKEQGFLTYAEVNDHLPADIVDSEQIEDIIGMINDLGIRVHEIAPNDVEALMSDAAAVVTDDDEAAEVAAAALASIDNEFGRTTDPVRMYMREMGTVELLTRAGELSIAKRIEEGQNQVTFALARFPAVIQHFIDAMEKAQRGEMRLNLLISKFIDPNQSDEIIRPDAEEQQEAQGEIFVGPDPKMVKEKIDLLKKRQKTVRG